MKKYSLLAVVAVALVAGALGCSKKPEAGGGSGAPASTGTAAPASTST